MKPYDRQLFRAAQQIHDALHGRQAGDSLPPLPDSTWRELLRSHRLLRRASAKGWSAADHSLLRSLRLRASDLTQAIEAFVQRLPRELQAERCSLRCVYEDLLALRDEFDEVRFDLKAGQLIAVTPPIELEEVELGRFEIRFSWSSCTGNSPYAVYALEANRAAPNDSVTHPHVQDDALCEGEGRLAIRAALQQGRLLDFFVLIRQVLETYNPGSAYVQLSNWSGVNCNDCGSTSSPDDSTYCERCSDNLCCDCSRCCASCSRTLCSGCSQMCTACECDCCSGCVADCSSCGESVCDGCRTEGQCRTCLNNDDNNEEEEDAKENTEETSDTVAAEDGGAADAQPKPAVHAVCLGEAGVPA